MYGPCPDSALLAAFIDGALEDYERGAVVTHLADCPHCRSVAITVAELRTIVTHAEWPTEQRVAEVHLPEQPKERWYRTRARAPARLVGLASAGAAMALLALVATYSPDDASLRAPVGLSTSATGARPSPRATTSSPWPAAESASVRRVSLPTAPRWGSNLSTGLPARQSLAGHDDAIEQLMAQVMVAPRDAAVANDLAAALYERSRGEQRLEDLPAALDAADRAVTLDASFAHAWFNRALILTALGMRGEAKASWDTYLSLDSTSSWARQAERWRQSVSEAPGAQWPAARDLFEATGAIDAARELVTRFPTRARDLFGDTLSRWATAVATGSDGSALRERLVTLGDAFEHIQRERTYRAVSAAVERATTHEQQHTLARLHTEFVAAKKYQPGSRPAATAARTELLRLAEAFADLDPASALRARVDAGTAGYFAGGLHAAVVSELAVAESEASLREYRVVAGRAAWIGGLSHYALGDLGAARVAYERLRAAASLPGDLDQLANAELLLGNLADIVGDHGASWAHRVRAIDLTERIDNPATTGNVYLGAAGQALSSGYLGAALVFQARLLGSPTALPPPLASQIRIQRATVLTKLARVTEAKAAIAQVRTDVARLDDHDMRDRREAELLALESELAQPDNATAAVRLAKQAIELAGRTTDAFLVSRLQRRLASAALALGELPLADQAISAAVAAFEDLRGGPTANAPGLSDHERPLYSLAARIAMRRGDLPRAFALAERRRGRTISTPHTKPALTLNELQQRLAPDAAVAVLEQDDDRLIVWVITRDDVAVRSLDVSAGLGAVMVAAHRREIGAAVTEPVVASQIFDLILRPAWPTMSRVRALTIVADAPFDRLAFAGLWDASRGRYLVEDLRLVTSPTASASIRSVPTDHLPRARATILAAAESGTSTPAVTRQLARLYMQSTVRTGADATPSALMRDIGERDVLHVTAAAVGGSSREKTSLVVADEPGRRYSGAVSMARLAATPPSARLVTLDLRSADDPSLPAVSTDQQVATALLAAGVPTVVGRVGGAPPADLGRLWVEFHRQYAAGVDAAESLRRAQLAALSLDRRAGPWATLAVFGAN